MTEFLVQLVLVGLALWVIWSLFPPRYVFEIQIREGRPRIRKGKVTPAFLAQVADVCREGGISKGRIAGVKCGKRIAVQFSKTIPPGLQQRLRNLWVSAR